MGSKITQETDKFFLAAGFHKHKQSHRGKGLYFSVGGYDLTKDDALAIFNLHEDVSLKLIERARVRGIIEALEGVNQFHYGDKGKKVVDNYVSIKDRLRPEGEDPAFSLPVSEAIDFYKEKLGISNNADGNV